MATVGGSRSNRSFEQRSPNDRPSPHVITVDLVRLPKNGSVHLRLVHTKMYVHRQSTTALEHIWVVGGGQLVMQDDIRAS